MLRVTGGHAVEGVARLGEAVRGEVEHAELEIVGERSRLQLARPFEGVEGGRGLAGGHAQAAEIDEQRGRIAAVIGDSTFAHSGITGLLNAVWNGRDGLYIVLDNGTTAMTGMQPNPMSGERLGRSDAPSVDYELLARAFGLPAANFGMVDAYDTAAISEAIDTLADRPGVRLLVVMGLCLIESTKLKKLDKLAGKKAARRQLLALHPIGASHE